MEDQENPTLKKTVEKDSGLKELVVEYIGEALEPEDGDVTVEMAIEIFAKEFPEFLMAVAEENFMRGYQQAFVDLEAHEKEREEKEELVKSEGE
tara:strand:+ start:5018 stop:5299 length:282 start_codon:yes stop_codon:yes gene_type:complete